MKKTRNKPTSSTNMNNFKEDQGYQYSRIWLHQTKMHEQNRCKESFRWGSYMAPLVLTAALNNMRRIGIDHNFSYTGMKPLCRFRLWNLLCVIFIYKCVFIKQITVNWIFINTVGICLLKTHNFIHFHTVISVLKSYHMDMQKISFFI